MANNTTATSGNSASSTVTPTQTNPTHFLSPFSTNLIQSPPVKLDKENYLFWCNMVMPIIKGHNLEGFILGTKVCPPETITLPTTPESETGGETVANPKYAVWQSTDQLLIGWLYSTMTSEAAMRVMGSNSSFNLWESVKETYGVQNKARITFLTDEMQKTRKGDLTVDQYLTKMKAIADNLEVAGKTIPTANLINQVLAGLDDEFTPIVVMLNIKDNITPF